MLDRTAADGGPVLPPHNSQVEQSLLGAILSRNDLLAACGGLQADHFFEPIHRQLFGIMSSMIREGRRADHRTMVSALPDRAIAPNGMTAAQYIARCAAEALSERPEEVRRYARELILLAWKRDIKARLEDVEAFLHGGAPAELAAALRETTTAIEASCPAAGADADGFLAFWHGDITAAESRPWLVYGTIPETGCGLLSGQWGTYKTFTAIEIACAVMSGTPIFDADIDRPGGVLLYAAEGQSEVPVRLQVSLENRCPHMAAPGNAPFAWLTTEKLSLTLLDPQSVRAFIARAKAISAEMVKRFGVPLVLIEIDTVITTAGYKKSGDEDDAVIGGQVIAALKEISAQTGAFVLGVDHFGKAAETGTRGTSVKETNVDVVLATLGERSISGVVTNPRCAVRKVRGGVTGREFAFTTETVPTDAVDPKGRPITTLKINWSAQADAACAAANGKKDPWTKSLRQLRKILMNLLVDCGKDVLPYLDGPKVRAVDKQIIRKEFYKEHPADGDTHEQRQDARRRAFNHALSSAQTAGLICVREIGDIQYIWLAETAPPREER
jgi:hypothetical protein